MPGRDKQDKTSAVATQIFRAILHGQYAPGDRVPTERAMAETTGTSRVTVRRAYAQLEEAGVLERNQGQGTFVSTRAQGHAAAPQHIALLTSVRDPFALEFIYALEQELDAQGSLLVLKVTEEDPVRERDVAIELVGRGLRNLVVWPCGLGFDAETFARLRVLGTNMVFFDRRLPGACGDFVGLDNRHAVTTLLEHAAARGFGKFVYLAHSGIDAISDHTREETFMQVCQSRGWTGRLERVPWRGGSVRQVLERNRREWFATDAAVVCVNDAVALEAREVLGPGAAVYGIDGLPRALERGVVTYEQPMSAMARIAVKLLAGQQKAAGAWAPVVKICKGRLLEPGTPQD